MPGERLIETESRNVGFTDPIERLVDKTGGKFALVVFTAARARWITDSRAGIANNVYDRPLVDTSPDIPESAVSIALREIDAGMITGAVTEPTEFEI